MEAKELEFYKCILAKALGAVSKKELIITSLMTAATYCEEDYSATIIWKGLPGNECYVSVSINYRETSGCFIIKYNAEHNPQGKQMREDAQAEFLKPYLHQAKILHKMGLIPAS